MTTKNASTSPSYGTNDPKGWGGNPRLGAALGRSSVNTPEPDTFATRLTLRRVRLDSGGYDQNGTYFGSESRGSLLYWCASSDGNVDMVLHAADRTHAMQKVRQSHPQVKFYGERKAS